MTAIINKTSLITQIDSIIAALNLSTDLTEEISLFYKSAINAGASASTIITELTNRIENASSTSELEELILLAVSASFITEDRVISVPDLTALNALTNIAAGSVYFVESEYAPYIRKSNGTWVLIDPSLQPAVVQNAWSWGRNSAGQLGQNNSSLVNRSSPANIAGSFTDWTQISSGNLHNLGIRANGRLYAWGNATLGVLGNNGSATAPISSPVLVAGGFTDWIQASAGQTHSLGLRATGQLYSWGSNGEGALGQEGTFPAFVSSPVLVAGGITDWIQASVGRLSGANLGLRANGTLYAWGQNEIGQLGDGNAVNRSSPALVAGGFTDWIQASIGGYHSLGVRANGTLYSWGANSYGQLGQNTAVTLNRSSPILVAGGFTNWIQANAGYTHSLGLRSTGQLYSWGRNNFGQLGQNTATTANRSSPILVVGGFTDWTELSSSTDHSLGVRANGTLYAWGAGSYGRLGNNSSLDISSPVLVAGGFTDWVNSSAGSLHSLGVRAG